MWPGHRSPQMIDVTRQAIALSDLLVSVTAMFHQLSKSSSNGVLKFACRAIPPNSNRLRRNSFVGRAVETPKFLDTCPSLGLSSQQGLPNVCACYEGPLYILRLHCRNFYDRLAILDNVIVHQA